jgi:heat-inducible transcriptional repressor
MKTSMADLTLRAKRILNAVVQEYLSSGDAVGSRTVTRRYGIDLSPATVRNVMADSRGARPAQAAAHLRRPRPHRRRAPLLHRLAAQGPQPLAQGAEEIASRYNLLRSDLDEVLQRTSRMLSDLAQQATIVHHPAPERQRLEHVEFVRLPAARRPGCSGRPRHLGRPGREQAHPRRELPADPGFLERVNNYLNERVKGSTLEEVRHSVLEESGRRQATRGRAGGRGPSPRSRPPSPPPTRSPPSSSRDRPTSSTTGSRRCPASSPGSHGPHAASPRRLEEKERIVRLLDRALVADGIQVWLGAETPFAEVGDVSIVATPYGPGDRRWGRSP